MVAPAGPRKHVNRIGLRVHLLGREESVTRYSQATMARSLVIVESPAKAKTINKYLGRDYNVKASYGHVMDLPKKTIGILLPGEENGQKEEAQSLVQIEGQGESPEKKLPKPIPVTAENIFEPTYEVIPSKLKVISDLRKAAAAPTPSIWRATRTARAKPSAPTWRKF